jgi:hypothetical protein
MFYKGGTVNLALQVVVASVMLTATGLPAWSEVFAREVRQLLDRLPCATSKP